MLLSCSNSMPHISCGHVFPITKYKNKNNKEVTSFCGINNLNQHLGSYVYPSYLATFALLLAIITFL